MRVAILNDADLLVVNVVKASKVSDVKVSSPLKAIKALDWMAPKKTYTMDGSTRNEVVVEPEDNRTIEEKKYELWGSCYGYQLKNIDQNLDREMAYARNLVKFNGAQESDFPKVAQLRDWLSSLYGTPADTASSDSNATYYERKAALLAGMPYSLDFSGFDPVPATYQDVAQEVYIYENP